MKQGLIALITVLLFLSEDTLVPILLPEGFQSVYIINPHLTLIAVVMISLYLGSTIGLIYGIVFGALADLSSANIFGLLLFVYGLVGNVAGTLLRVLHRNVWLILTTVGVASLMLDLVHYSIFRLFAFTSQDWSYVLLRQIIPNSLVNVAIAVLLYPIFHKLLSPMYMEFQEKEGRSSHE